MPISTDSSSRTNALLAHTSFRPYSASRCDFFVLAQWEALQWDVAVSTNVGICCRVVLDELMFGASAMHNYADQMVALADHKDALYSAPSTVAQDRSLLKHRYASTIRPHASRGSP